VNQLKSPANGYQSRVWKGNLRLFLWNGAWAAATMLMALGPKFLWHKVLAFTLPAIGLDLALDLALGVGVILATKRYVMELDELQQRVLLNALGITVGVAMIAVPPLSVMDVAHMLPFHVNISHLIMLMAVTFVVSLVYGSVRYQ
jgi:hypothetical protein